MPLGKRRSPAFPSPLRYPGGKSKLTPFFKKLLETNDLVHAEYAEPYAGGSGVALSLLMSGYASRIHLNDINAGVYSFWNSVLNATEELCRKIRDTRITVEEWHHQQHIQKNSASYSQVDVAFATLFLNRTNRSGIICGGGMIGGTKQEGDWRIDARFYRNTLIERVKSIAALSKSISLYNLDAEVFIQSCVSALPTRSLLYLDPPYYAKGHRLYEDHYSSIDHSRLAELIQSGIAPNWVVSYDNVRQVRQLYRSRMGFSYRLSYTATKRRVGSEIIVLSDGLTAPPINVCRPLLRHLRVFPNVEERGSALSVEQIPLHAR